MRHPLFDTLNQAGIELKPGQIYWFRSPHNSIAALTGSELEKYIRNYSGNLGHGVRFQIIEKTSPSSALADKVVGCRFNIGSLGKHNLLIDDFSDILGFIQKLSDVSSMDDTPVVDLSRKFDMESRSYGLGISPSVSTHFFMDDLLGIEDTKENMDMFESSASMECCPGEVETKKPADLSRKSKKCGRNRNSLGNLDLMSPMHSLRPRERKQDAEDLQDDKEVEMLEKAKSELVQKITDVIVDYVNATHQMPPMEEIYELIKGKVVLTPTGLSRLVVNEHLKIRLPDYNELEVSFRPLPMTIYILFLRHLDGIVLNYISDYASELEEIYSIVMPNRDPNSASKSIRSLTDTLSGSLNQKITIIKRTFKANILNEEMAAKYYISGSRGDAYKIALPKEFIQLPAVFN